MILAHRRVQGQNTLDGQARWIDWVDRDQICRVHALYAPQTIGLIVL